MKLFPGLRYKNSLEYPGAMNDATSSVLHANESRLIYFEKKSEM